MPPSFDECRCTLRPSAHATGRAVPTFFDAAMAHLRTYIVEDSPVIRENLIATLEEMVPVEVIGTAEDEASAAQWLGRTDNACDLVIIDIFLKSGSGLGVLQAARKTDGGRKLVVLSNYATPDMRRKCLQLGADEVFDKSNEIDGLISYCARLASGEQASSDSGVMPQPS